MLTTESTSSDQRLGIALMLAGYLTLALNDAATKWLTAGYPVGQIVFFRGAVAAMLIVAVECLRSNGATLIPRNYRGQLGRGLLFACSTILVTISLKFLPLAAVTAVLFMSPILLTLLAGPLLNEGVGWRALMASGIGFAGVFFIVSPGGTSLTWLYLIPLLAALASALRDITTRHLAFTESTSSIVLVTAVVAACMGLLTLPGGNWRWPDVADTCLFLFLGAAQLGAHYLQVEAFRLARASLLAPLKYSMVVWATILGILVWGDVPQATILVGAALVILAGVIVYRSKTPMA